MRVALAILLVSFAATPARATCTAGEPTAKYSGRTISITVCASNVASSCKDKCYLGATVRRAEDANQFDLPAKEMTAADLANPVTISHEVGTGYVEYQVAIWTRKTDCGDSKRHGCKEYGYLMDGEALLFHPEWDFWENSPWAKIKPPKVQLLDAGGGAALVKKARSVLKEHTIKDGGSASNKRDKIEVLYRCAWERKTAWAIAKTLRDATIGVAWEVKHWAEAPEDFVVAVGAP